MAKPIEHLVAVLADRDIEVTPEQAEAMAVRLSGSVEAYLDDLRQYDAEREGYAPLKGEPSHKFKEPIGYEIESFADSGLPGDS